MADEIEIVEYDRNWPRMFDEERVLLEMILPADQILAIEHAGSTAIPDLAAKPIIDIFVAVRSVEVLRATLIDPIEATGYVYWAENPDRSRMFFVKGMPPYGTRRTHHVHVLEPTSDAWQRVLVFRDYLREHHDEAQRYLRLKRRLAQQYPSDREAYTRAKDSYIIDVVELARKAGAPPRPEA